MTHSKSGPLRIVAGLDSQGRSVVVSEARIEAQAFENISIAQMWTGGIIGKADSHAPVEAAGAPFRMEQMAQPVYSMMVADYAPGLGRDDPGMHSTDTADHFYVIEGEVVLVLESGDVVLRAGDVGIVRGVVHGWRNDSDSTARLVTFVLPATPAVPA